MKESEPTTSLQLRLPDGSRMVARFNHTHTLRDVRRFVRASRPDLKVGNACSGRWVQLGTGRRVWMSLNAPGGQP